MACGIRVSDQVVGRLYLRSVSNLYLEFEGSEVVLLLAAERLRPNRMIDGESSLCDARRGLKGICLSKRPCSQIYEMSDLMSLP
jgi:hypothetical protein